MKELRSFLIQIKRALCSRTFAFACFGIAALMYITGFQYIRSGADAIGAWGFARGTGIFIMTLSIFPLFPFSLSYADEHNEKNLSVWTIRVGVKSYMRGKYVAAIVAGMLSYMVGNAVCILLNCLHAPLFTSVSSGDPYVGLLENGHSILYLAALFFHYSLSAALFCALTMCVSVWCPNRFAAVILPMVVYLLIARMMANVPWYFNITGLIEATVDAGTIGLTLLLKAVVSLLFLVVMGSVVIEKAERRLQNE